MQETYLKINFLSLKENNVVKKYLKAIKLDKLFKNRRRSFLEKFERKQNLRNFWKINELWSNSTNDMASGYTSNNSLFKTVKFNKLNIHTQKQAQLYVWLTLLPEDVRMSLVVIEQRVFVTRLCTRHRTLRISQKRTIWIIPRLSASHWGKMCNTDQSKHGTCLLVRWYIY